MTISEFLITAIKLRLRELFPEVEVYSNKHKSGISTPAFFVRNIDSRTQDLLDGNRWIYNQSYSIEYMGDEDSSSKLQAIKEGLIFGFKDFKKADDDYYIRAVNESSFSDLASNKDLVYTADFKIEVYKEAERVPYMDVTEIEPTVGEWPPRPNKDPNMWESEEKDDEEKENEEAYNPKGEEVGLMDSLSQGWR